MTVQPLVQETVVADGASYRVSWFDPPFHPPLAESTQALGICFTPESQIVLVTWNDADWTLPGGTIEPGETLEQTLPYYQTRFWARVELEPFTPTREMTARKLVRPREFLDTLFWGRETTAALILERGLRIQTERSADAATPRPSGPA